METSLPSDTTETIQENEDNLLSEIPGLQELPSDTQEVVVESYKSYNEILQVEEGYNRGTTEYIDKIPKAIAIIDNNLSPKEINKTSVLEEKKEYIDETVNLVKICQKVTELGIDNIDTKKQLAIYLVFEKYGAKYSVGKIEKSISGIEEIEKVKEYYAKTPKATLRRIRDSISQRNEKPTFTYPYQLERLAQTTLLDYTNGSKSERDRKLSDAFGDFSLECSNASFASDDFLGMIDTKTKEINNLHESILIEEICKEEITKRTEASFVDFPDNRFKDPLLESKERLSAGIESRLFKIRDALFEDIDRRKQDILKRDLSFRLIPELNQIRSRINHERELFAKNIGSIHNMLPFKSVSSISISDIGTEYLVTDTDMQKEEEELKEVLHSGKLIFHGAYTTKSRLSIASKGLMSRTRQEKDLGWSYYNTIPISQASEEDRSQYSSLESEMLFFAPELEDSYSFDPPYHFVVGIPEGTAAREYSHRGDGIRTGSDISLMDRENPENGCYVKPEHAYLYVGESIFEKMKIASGEGDEFEKKARALWGDRLIISNEGPPKEIKDFSPPPVKKARKLPDDSFYTMKFGQKHRVYRTEYS